MAETPFSGDGIHIPLGLFNNAGDQVQARGRHVPVATPIGDAGQVWTVNGAADGAEWADGGSGAVSSVNGQTGVVVLDTTDVGGGTAAVRNTGFAVNNVPIVTAGTPDGTKFLRDDGTWTAVSGGSNAADYLYFEGSGNTPGTSTLMVFSTVADGFGFSGTSYAYTTGQTVITLDPGVYQLSIDWKATLNTGTALPVEILLCTFGGTVFGAGGMEPANAGYPGPSIAINCSAETFVDGTGAFVINTVAGGTLSLTIGGNDQQDTQLAAFTCAFGIARLGDASVPTVIV